MSTEPFNAAMDCLELERSVDAWLDGELDDPDRGELTRHLDACARCRSLADTRRRLLTDMRAKLQEAMSPPAREGCAPPELRARVTQALARQRRPVWRRAFSPLPIATAAACLAGVLVVLATRPDDTLAEEAIAKHNRGLPLEVTAASVGGETLVPAWFNGKLDFKATPPRFEGPGVKVIGARLSHLREWPAAYYRYALPRGQAGLYVVDDPQGRFDVAGRDVRVGTDTVRLANARGYNVAVWRHEGIVYSLVSDLDEQDLFTLVRTAQAGSGR